MKCVEIPNCIFLDNGSSGEEEEESEVSDIDELKDLNLSNSNGITSIADVIHQATIQSKLKVNI